MVDEFGSSIDNAPQIGTGSEAIEGAQEAEISRIEAQAKKAKQISGFIAKDKKQNDMVARFLMLLLQNISDEDLIQTFHRVFFRMKDPKTGHSRIRNKTNNMLMIGLFVPFFQKEIDGFAMTHFFHSMYPIGQFPTLENYNPYLQRLTFNHFSTVPVEQKDYLELIMQIKIYYKLISQEEIEGEKKSIYLKAMAKALFDQKLPPAPLPQPITTPNDRTHHGSHGHHRQI